MLYFVHYFRTVKQKNEKILCLIRERSRHYKRTLNQKKYCLQVLQYFSTNSRPITILIAIIAILQY